MCSLERSASKWHFSIISHWYLILKIYTIFFYSRIFSHINILYFHASLFRSPFICTRLSVTTRILYERARTFFYEWESMNCIARPLCVHYFVSAVLLDWIIDIVRSEFVRNSDWNEPSIAFNGIPMRTIDWLSIAIAVCHSFNFMRSFNLQYVHSKQQ